MSDPTEQSPDDGQVEPDALGLAEARKYAKRERARRKELEQHFEEFEPMLRREREERRQVEARIAIDAQTIGDLTAELAFTKAGVDTEGTAGRLFAQRYDGPLEVEAVQSAYAGYLADALQAGRQFAAHVVRTQPNGHEPESTEPPTRQPATSSATWFNDPNPGA